MRNSICGVFCALTFLTFNVFTQSQFQLTIGGSGTGFEYAASIIQTSGGGYAFVGTTSSFGAGDYDIYIVTLDAGGSIQWTKTIGGAGREWGRNIIQTSDGGYAVCGSTSSFSAGPDDMYIIKLDATGDLEWSKTIGDTAGEVAYSIIQSPDGGLIAAGFTYSYGAGQSDMFIVRLDASGVFQWSKTIGGTGSESASTIIKTTDGGYALAGSTNSFGAGGNDLFIVKLDASGSPQWSLTAGGPAGDGGGSIIQTADGGYAAAGNTNSFGAGIYDMYILKLNSSGALQWTRTVGGKGYDIGRSITLTADGGYAIAGWTNSFGTQPRPNDMYVVKLSGSGSLQWTKVLGSTNMIDEAYDITQTSDGKITVAGETAYWESTAMDCYLVKFELNGNTCGYSVKPKSSSGTGGTITPCVPSVSLQMPPVIDQTSIEGSGGAVTMICSRGGGAGPQEDNLMGENNELPRQFSLEQNYPNPFNPSTTINFSLPSAGHTSLKVNSVLGEEVAVLISRNLEAGSHSIQFDGSNLASGIYYYRLESAGNVEVKKMLLVK